MRFVTRRQWGARSPKAGADYLATTRGVKVHYTGSYVDPRLVDDHDRCEALMRQIQAGHMDGNGWNDVGYTAACCPHGYVFEGRGRHAIPAANGPGLNSGHYAVLGMVGNKGLTEPTAAMLDGIRDAIDWLRDEAGAGGEIKGHRDGYSTDCPGAKLYTWVKQGAPRPTTTNEEDLDMKPIDVYKAVWETDEIPAPDGDPTGKNPTWRAASVLTAIDKRSRATDAKVDALAADNKALREELAATNDRLDAILAALTPKT